MGVRAFAAAVAALLTILAASHPAGAQDDRLLFCGFEKEELSRHFQVHRNDGDKVHLILPGDRGRVVYTINKGVSSEGDWALVVSVGEGQLLPEPGRIRGYEVEVRSQMDWEPRYRNASALRPGFLANMQPPERFTEAVDFSGGRMLESASHHSRTLLYTKYDEAGVHYTLATFPTDWSGYDLLRLDVRPESAELTMRVACEDDRVAPPVERRYTVPAGKWSTLEIDLAEAVKRRGLGLSKMENFWLFLEETAGPSLVYFDNVRLSSRDAEATHPTLPGEPKAPRPVAEMPEPSAADPRREIVAPVSDAATAARLPGPWNREASLVLWAYDNDRIVLCNGPCCYYTADAGKTWQNLRGGSPDNWREALLALPGGSTSDLQGTSFMGPGGDVLFFGNYGPCLYHCAPSVDSLYFRAFVFSGDGWTPSPFYIAGGETRACSGGRQIVCLPSGRIWAVYRVAERFRQQPVKRIHAMYSDDRGITWRGGGLGGELTGTLADTLVGGPSDEGSGTRKRYCDPLAIVPYGEHVACIWAYRDGWWWSYYDGQSWCTQMEVTSELLARRGTRRYRAVGFPGKEDIFLATDGGIVHWDGTGWKDEPGPKAALLSVTGKPGADVICAVGPEGDKLLLWRRADDGRWSAKTVAEEGPAIEAMAVPQRSPEHFVPVAWRSGLGMVKLLRVPVEDQPNGS